jgi:hypothetical protein
MQMPIRTRFDHLGLAVREPSDAIIMLESLGYRIGQEVFDPLQNVRLTLCTHEEQPTIELIAPGSSAGPLEGILKTKDALAYHCCYRVDSAEQAIAALESAGVRIMEVLEPTPAALFPGHCVSFYTAAGFGLFELLEPASSQRGLNP